MKTRALSGPFLGAFALSAVLFSACSEPAIPQEAPILPLLGFSQPQTRAVISDPEITSSEVMFAMQTPLITGFDMDNAGGLTSGDSYEVEVLGARVPVSISKQADGTWLYTATLADGWCRTVYDPVSRSFSYEQIVIWNIDHEGMGGSMDAVTWIEGQSIPLTLSGDYQAMVDFGVYIVPDGYDPEIFSGKAEVYRGALDERGSGVGWRSNKYAKLTFTDFPAESGGILATALAGDVNKPLETYRNYLRGLADIDRGDLDGSISIFYGFDDRRLLSYTPPMSGAILSPIYLMMNLDDYAAMEAETPSTWRQNGLITD